MEQKNHMTTEPIGMVENALRVLDCLKKSDRSLGVNEVAKLCELSPSTCFRILKTLKADGWAFQLHDDRYIPGEKISFVTSHNNAYIALQDAAAVIMEHYAKEYHAPMNLMVLDQEKLFILQQARTGNIVDYITPVYSRLPFYTAAAGKILLSELPVNVVDTIMRKTDMKPVTPNTISDPDIYWKELRKTVKRGYAFDNHESSMIGSAIAVPVRNNRGKIIASLSFCGFIGMDDPDKMLPYLEPLNEASARISRTFTAVWKKA